MWIGVLNNSSNFKKYYFYPSGHLQVKIKEVKVQDLPTSLRKTLQKETAIIESLMTAEFRKSVICFTLVV